VRDQASIAGVIDGIASCIATVSDCESWHSCGYKKAGSRIPQGNPNDPISDLKLGFPKIRSKRLLC
jgi:hypothetical protein